MRTTILAAIGLAAGSALSGAADARSLHVATGRPESHAHTYGSRNFAAYPEANADVSPQVFPRDLPSLSEIPNGSRDGIAEVGNVVTACAAANYSETNLIADLSMTVTAGEAPPLPAAMSGAVMEYVPPNCPTCVAKYAAQNQVFLGSASTSPCVLLCRDPAASLDVMRGLTFRSGTEKFGRWAEHVGAVKATLPGNERYEAMSQGVVECAMPAVTTLLETSLIDVTGAVLNGVSGGVFAGLADTAVNLDVRRELSREQREVFLQGSSELVEDIVEKQVETEDGAYVAAVSQGLGIPDASGAILSDHDTFVQSDPDVIARSFATRYGIVNVAQKIDAAVGLIDKGKSLTRDGTDREALAELYWTEVLSKVEPATCPS